MKIFYISDIIGDFLGGAEQNDSVLLSLLEDRGHEIVRVKSDHDGLLDLLSENEDAKIIVSNFVFMFARARQYIEENFDYIIYEHDHKYLQTRDPSQYEDYKAPADEIRYTSFYQNARAVFCQSNLHADILTKNVPDVNVVTVGGNLWDSETLDLIQELSSVEKNPEYCIMYSAIGHKNTSGCIKYCNKMEIPYVVVGPLPHKDFLREMAKYETFFFMPQTVETLSRIVVEARMMNCKVITNKNVGAASMDWFLQSGQGLIDTMRGKLTEIPDLVEEHFQ